MFALLVSGAFCLLSLAGILHHELWRDEWLYWMLGRDSASLTELLANLRYETGNPFLWGILLHWLSRISQSPIVMQLLHSAIATATVFLLARFAPFPKWQKLCLVLSYFLLFEYAQISRNYGLGLLVIFLFCVLFRSRQRSYLPLAATLALMANVNFYSRLLALALTALLGLEWVLERSQGDRLEQQKGWQKQGFLALSLVVLLAGFGLSILQNIPPANAGASLPITTAGFSLNRLIGSVSGIWKAYFPLPGLTLRFWNTNIIDDGFATALVWVPIAFSLALFRRQPLILFLYLFNLSEILVFHYFFYGVTRHIGHIFILFVVCLWLLQDLPPLPPPNPGSRSFFQQYQRQFIAAVLAIQVGAGLFAFTMDWLFTFSEAKSVAQFIKSRSLSSLVIAGSKDFAAMSVAGYLDQKVYYTERQSFGTFISWDNKSQALTPQQVFDRVGSIAGRNTALVVLNYPLVPPLPRLETHQITELARFTGAIVRDENYYLYSLTAR